MQSTFEIKGNGLNALMNVLTETPKQLPKELVRLSNNIAKEHKKAIGREVRKFVAIKNKDILKHINQTKKATVGSYDAKLELRGVIRIPLKYFGARQTKKGVSYRIGKQGSRGKISNAFGPNIPRLGGHVWVREGKARLPIRKLYGPSVLASYLKNDLLQWSSDQLSDELGKQAAKRVRSIIVNQIKKQGRAEGISTDLINDRIKQRLG